MAEGNSEYRIMNHTISTFLRPPDGKIEPEEYKTYFTYYEDTWHGWKNGEEGGSLKHMSHEEVRMVIESITKIILNGSSCDRKSLRQRLLKEPRFHHCALENLNGIIDLSLRLWLTLNIRDRKFSYATHSVQWDDHMPLQVFIRSLFPGPRMLEDSKDINFLLPANFTAVKLRRYSGINIDWTTSLNEHLSWDRTHRTLKIYPLKAYLRELGRR